MKIKLLPILLSLVLLNALAKNQIFAAKSYFSYKVRSGDNLTVIARRYHTRISELRRFNKMRRGQVLYAGRRIKIPRRKNRRSGRHRRYKRRSYSPRSGSIHLGKPVRNRIATGFRTGAGGSRKNYGLVYKIRSARPIKVAQKGRVLKIARMRGYGRYILVDHGAGWISMYSNLHRVLVKKGEVVSKYDKIAEVKNSSFFFLVSFKGQPVNPIRYFR